MVQTLPTIQPAMPDESAMPAHSAIHFSVVGAGIGLFSSIHPHLKTLMLELHVLAQLLEPDAMYRTC